MVLPRRQVLTSGGGIFTASIAGCLQSDNSEPPDLTSMEPDQSRETISQSSAYYPTEGMGIPTISAHTGDGSSSDTAQTLSELETAAHRDAILAITRETYYPSEDITGEEGLEGGTTWVKYGSTVFGVEKAVGSRTDVVEFDRVLTLDTSLSAGKLKMAVRNDGQEPYELGHVGRPYFGILLAWDGDHHLLGNEKYAANDFIVSEDGYAYPAWADEDVTRPDDGWIKLPPRETVEETYIVPERVSDGAFIYVEVPYRSTNQEVDTEEKESHPQRVVWYLSLDE